MMLFFCQALLYTQERELALLACIIVEIHTLPFILYLPNMTADDGAQLAEYTSVKTIFNHLKNEE